MREERKERGGSSAFRRERKKRGKRTHKIFKVGHPWSPLKSNVVQIKKEKRDPKKME